MSYLFWCLYSPLVLTVFLGSLLGSFALNELLDNLWDFQLHVHHGRHQHFHNSVFISFILYLNSLDILDNEHILVLQGFSLLGKLNLGLSKLIFMVSSHNIDLLLSDDTSLTQSLSPTSHTRRCQTSEVRLTFPFGLLPRWLWPRVRLPTSS